MYFALPSSVSITIDSPWVMKLGTFTTRPVSSVAGFVWAAALGYLLFGEVPSSWSLASAALIVGGCLLLWIGFQLLSDDEEEEGGSKTYGSLVAAVRTILIADLVMSLDNVIAVAAAAQGNVVLLVLGLAISIPLVIFGSTLMIKLMERFPIIVVLGAALIGWVGGETIASDAILHDYAVAHPALHYVAAALGAALLAARNARQRRRVVAQQPGEEGRGFTGQLAVAAALVPPGARFCVAVKAPLPLPSSTACRRPTSASNSARPAPLGSLCSTARLTRTTRSQKLQ